MENPLCPRYYKRIRKQLKGESSSDCLQGALGLVCLYKTNGKAAKQVCEAATQTII